MYHKLWDRVLIKGILTKDGDYTTDDILTVLRQSLRPSELEEFIEELKKGLL